MEQTLQETFLSPVWWISTIFIAFIVSIIANKATDPVGNIFGRMFASVRNLNEKRRKKYEDQIEYLINNPQEEVILTLSTNQMSLQGQTFQVLGIIITIVGVAGWVIFQYIHELTVAVLDGGRIEITRNIQIMGQDYFVQVYAVFPFLTFFGVLILLLGFLLQLSQITAYQMLTETGKRRKDITDIS